MKLIFAPIGIVSGLLAGLLARKGFERLWALIDEEDPPDPGDRGARYAKLVPALLVEGAIFSLAKGIVDRGARVVFARATGTWPGDEAEKGA